MRRAVSSRVRTEVHTKKKISMCYSSITPECTEVRDSERGTSGATVRRRAAGMIVDVVSARKFSTKASGKRYPP